MQCKQFEIVVIGLLNKLSVKMNRAYNTAEIIQVLIIKN
jgi:hypothetical protein